MPTPFIPHEFGAPFVTVGTFHAIEVEALDFDRAAVALTQLAEYIEEVTIPLAAAKKIAVDDMKERFDTETAPDGSQWRELTDIYAARKVREKGFEHPILTYDKDLRRDATSQSRWSVSGESIFFNTEGLPEYWRVHQEGSEDWGSFFHSGAADETKKLPTSAGSGAQNIPPRPFIGLSAEAEDKILELFDIWFSEGLENVEKQFVTSSRGVLQHRVSGGRFGPKVVF